MLSISISESDFNGQQLVREVPSTATSQALGYTFTVDIGIIDDDIRELNDEYFLLFVNGSQSPRVDTITYPDRSRECIRTTIQSDQDREILLLLLLVLWA